MGIKFFPIVNMSSHNSVQMSNSAYILNFGLKYGNFEYGKSIQMSINDLSCLVHLCMY